MIETRRVHAYDFWDETSSRSLYWRDVGTLDSYYSASMEMLGAQPPFDLWSASFPRDAALARPAISPSSRVSRTMLCDGSEVDDAAEIEDCVLMPGAKVNRGSRLRRVIVDEGVQIPEGFTAGWDLEVDRLHHIVSPGGVVVVSHVPHSARVQIKRERTTLPGWRESESPAPSTGDGRPLG
jgi:glucose-1-phosphate adenylyltransferase